MIEIKSGFKPGYYYLHVNSSIIWKPKLVVEMDKSFFDSPYVVKYWKVETEMDYENMKIEAKKLS